MVLGRIQNMRPELFQVSVGYQIYGRIPGRIMDIWPYISGRRDILPDNEFDADAGYPVHP